jgi:Arc-like DNA binding domain
MMSTTITVAILVALIIGLAFGSVIAGLALMERRSTRHWVVYLRLPEDLHRRLSEAATAHGWSLRAEIINRLEASFGPTRSYEF